MKGRKSRRDTVVPLKGEQFADGSIEGHRQRAAARAAELKPRDLDHDQAAAWDEIAPVACDPTRRKRLDADTVHAFVLLIRAKVRFERLERDLASKGELYTAKTRNGVQMKSTPAVAQRNVAWRQYLTMLQEFGMTPLAERSLASGKMPKQGELLDFGDDVG